MGHFSETMMYNAKNGAPWHQTGRSIEGTATLEEVQALVPEMFIPVKKEPMFDKTGSPVDGRYLIVRQNESRTVHGVCQEEYSVLQDETLFKLAETICQDANGPLFETAGMLWDGAKTWVLARFPDFMTLKGRNRKEDNVCKYLLFSNAHDSSQKLRVGSTAVRVVCDNTLNMAHARQKRNSSAYVSHSGDLTAKLTNVAELLQIASKDFEETQELYQALMNCEPSKEQIDTVLRALIPDTATKRAELQRDRVLQLANTGRGNAEFEGTAWSLYNGCTELSDWYANEGSKRDDALDMRANSALFGSGSAWKGKALEVISSTCLN